MEAMKYRPVRVPASLTKPSSVQYVPWEHVELQHMPQENLLTQFQHHPFGNTDIAPVALTFNTRKDKKNTLTFQCGICYTENSCSSEQRGVKGLPRHLTTSVMCNIKAHACSKTHQTNLTSYYKGKRDALQEVAYFKHDSGEHDYVDVSDSDGGLHTRYKRLKAYCQWREDMLLSHPTNGTELDFPDELKSCPDATPSTMHKLASIGSTGRPSGDGASTGTVPQLDLDLASQ